MSIERMKRMWLVSPREGLRPLLDFLATLKAVHLIDAGPEGAGADEEAFSRLAAETTPIDARIARLRHILEVMNAWHPPTRTFGENFVNFPLEVTPREMAEAIETVDIDGLDRLLTALADEAVALRHRIEEIHLELRHLGTWTTISGPAPTHFRWCVAFLGTATERMARMLSESEEAREVLVVNERGRGKDNRVLLQVVALKEDEARAGELLRQFEFVPLPLPFGVSVGDMIRALEVELRGYEERTDAIHATLTELTEKHRTPVTSVLAYWETRREVVTSQERSLNSKRMTLVCGYVLAREARGVAAEITRTFPRTAVTLEDPAPRDEAVPVELRTRRLFAPAQFLTRMFGLPPYASFDPSPLALFNFLLFFGFCFGDVIYGLGLIALSVAIALRVRPYRGCYQFFTLMALGGVSATVVGALTGAWAGDLPLQLKEAFGVTVFEDVRQGMMLADPLTKPVLALLVSLGVGILNQFYGVLLRIYREVRRRDYASAAFDGGLWLLVLPGLILSLTALFSPPVPILVSKVGLWIFLTGALGLVLTQGRREETLAGKIIVGVVSIYGILGSYGATGFIGDVLSYSRLLALGLTTTIMGSCFNLIAKLPAGVPYVGPLIFIVIVVVGHAFNFFISILGGFVHSARLVFVEFFGRFYESGGERFHPLGTSERVRVAGERI